ncbi:alpha/beta fold hydrolase [Micromonospora inyonensis]|uniref:Pimeloyl-ACP methyl ester carboxylesterase n=1 Tax=Micromonospora inyonensis TaxID=47866 RepID=A0A1C6S6J0_9ACTN|nr:alpha/beta fold hydrolase [Micromonospora inyonensis]SCL25103.1 Pimeloyl-ACP methyl ester carboxylesterase [Micromonospora inyonensis]
MSTIKRDQISVGGLVTSFLSAGSPSAPPLVLLHDGAWGGSAEASWINVIPTLAERYQVIAPDLYGYGSSSKMVQLDVAPYEFRLRQVAALLDTLRLEDHPAHLVGNSFGGAMALRAATLPWFSWRVRTAVSIAGTGGPYRTREALAALSHFDGSHADMLRVVRLLTGQFPAIDDHVELRLRDACNPGHYRAVAAAGLATPFEGVPRSPDDYPQSLRTVRTPLALVSGRQDDLVEPDWAHRIAEHAPSCRVYEIDAKHSPNISDPEATATLLLTILEELESDAAAQDHAAPGTNR